MAPIEAPVAELEAAITNKEFEKARAVLRDWFSLRASSEVEDSSVGGWLGFFAESPNEYADVASVVIRCSCVQGLIEPNVSNRIKRSVVTLAEGALPGLVRFQKIEPKEQNYVKYNSLTRTHKIATLQLDPLRIEYGDLNAIVEARKTIVGALNHKGLKEYLKPFGLDEVRTTLTNVLGQLKRVTQIEDTLLDDVESCQRSIRDAANFSENLGTFLASDCLTPFLHNVDSVLQEFLKRLRGRFAADISLALAGSQLKKRYPLHEASREFRVSVPLRNSGPGRAMDVRVSCNDSDNTIVVDSMAFQLGNVASGEFEVNFNCLVSTPSQEINFLVSVEWGEIGTPRRQNAEFLIQALAQSAGLDWGSLEYWSPYSTAVAEGDAFVGRKDKVRQLAGKILRSPMEPFYVTGQKRVGKTSLAIAAANFAENNASDGTLHSPLHTLGKCGCRNANCFTAAPRRRHPRVYGCRASQGC